MSKLIFWVFVILVALLVSRIAARNAVKQQTRSQTRKGKGGKSSVPEIMVRCAHCGIHLPASEAVRRKGFNYCGLAHSLRGPRLQKGARS
jgi:uncharacterized protein